MSSIEHVVKAAIAQKLGLKEEEITSDASIVEDLGADSLDGVEMVITLEGKFNLDIPDEDAAEIRTVRQAIEYIHHAIEKRA